MTITCSRSELSDTGHQAGVVDSYLETQCTEQFAVLSQTNWIWATWIGAPDRWLFGSTDHMPVQLVTRPALILYTSLCDRHLTDR